MPDLYVSINRARLHLRYAQSLKDKRQVIRSLKQKLRNNGFSVVECGDQDNPKCATLGFCYAGSSYAQAEKEQNAAKQLFMGEFEVLSYQARLDSFDSDEM